MSVELGVLWRCHEEDREDDEAEDGQDDEGRDEHPLPIPVAPTVRNQLLQFKSKFIIITYVF